MVKVIIKFLLDRSEKGVFVKKTFQNFFID